LEIQRNKAFSKIRYQYCPVKNQTISIDCPE
jgi:hypothetical protein